MISTPPGVFDILPTKQKNQEWRYSGYWEYVEKIMRETARDFGYQEIRTPIFERTELFTRSVGETSDIVTKEMYTFQDKGERSMTLRPEGTAPVIRAFIEHKLNATSPISKLFYIAPMFRYERSQAGRYRQHHQFGAESIGNDSPEQDVELIDMLYTLYQRLSLKNLTVYINSIGDSASREKFKIALKSYYQEHFEQLSADSKIRFEKNPLRILDSKDAGDIAINSKAPSILDYLEPDAKNHFETVKQLMTQLNIPYVINDKLVRGLDYYNKTVFEITAGELGSQNSVGGGGRYDGLIKSLKGPDLASIGFGTGIERIIQTMIAQGVSFPDNSALQIFIIPLGDEAKHACFSLLHDLRQKGISAEMDFSGKKLGKLMQYANDIGAKHVVVIGENELKTEMMELKNMQTGISHQIPFKNLSRILKIEADTANFIGMWSEMSKPFEHDLEVSFFAKKLNSSIKETSNLSSHLLKSMETMQGLLENQ